jgi:hypothetical protein
MEDTPNKRLEISEEDMAKVMRARQRHEKTKVNDSWLFLAEFGYYFGWDGIQAIRTDSICIEEAEALLIGARKVWNGKVYDQASASFIGSVSAQSKRPAQTFKKITTGLLKSTKADK